MSRTPVSFNFPAPVRFGEGVIHELPAYLLANAIRQPLVVTDPQVAKLDFCSAMLDEIRAAGMEPVLFADIHANPVKSDVLKGGQVFHENGCDAIIGLGGGAAIDVARAVVLHVYHPRDLFDYDDLLGGDQYVTRPVPLFVTVPTAAGTGSEVGRSAIIAEDETKKKRILFSPKLMAAQVFADPQLTYGLPPKVTAATGMDALTHHLEAYLAKNYHPMCEGIALEGIRMIGRSLEKATLDPDPESRSEMLLASLMGAVAFQKGLGVVHSLAHPLSALLDMHHGLANAINLPYGLAFNLPGQSEKFRQIAFALNLETLTGEAVLDHLLALNTRLGLPLNLADAGVTAQDLPELTALAEADFAHPNNPRPVSKEDFAQLYLHAFTGEKNW